MEQSSEPEPPTGGPAAWPDAVLVARLRLGDERAVAELYARFQPLLLDEARRRRVDVGVRREVVMDTITTAALVLMRSETPIPGSLAGYLVTALRRRALNVARAARRAAARQVPLDEGTLRVEPGAPGAHAVSAPVVRLAGILDAHLKPEERQLLAWLGDRVPQREIAAWLGSTYGAVRVRVLRLRERLREIARRHAATLPPDERVELERFLQRVAPSRPPATRRAAAPSHGTTGGGDDDGPTT